MEGKALVWFQDLEAYGTITSWDGFVQALQTWFGPTSYEDPMEALTRLRQTSIIEHYNSQFDHLSNQLQGLVEPYKLSCFFKWTSGGHLFHGKYVKPINFKPTIGGCDMVLGVQQLQTLGPILWDFDRLHMDF